MTLEFIIIILVVSYLRKSLNTMATMPEWNKRLLLLMYSSIVLIILQAILPKFGIIAQWMAIVILSALLYIIYTNDKFRTAKFLIVAILPYLLVSATDEAIKLINQGFYNRWSDLLEISETFGIIWGAGTWIVTRKQQKELIKARERTREEEQNNKIIIAMKEQLEVQVAERTEELTRQKEELEMALNELKSMQAQLIQSEKMASLGELTAGIAHEIQNPLNFVNNFSEVNRELIEEFKSQRAKLKTEEQDEILNDIYANEEKINHHGKRADAIVKGMLQHSRKNNGIKELTNINALADEYLRLSYQGLRAKNKSFNSDIKTDFDVTIGNINIVPQDIGRVLLNLFNNAFYATSEKQKAKSVSQEDYKPLVSIQTKKINDKVEIAVKDNGNGIPQKVIDKIFQPFFTTKPSGEGTGLGLSLSYDIIKAHGGEIKVVSEKDKFTEFIILLPF